MKYLNYIISFFKNLWFTQRFFALAVFVIVLFVISFVIEIVFLLAQLALVALAVISIVDIFILYNSKEAFSCERQSQKLLSNGDENTIKIGVKNLSSFDFDVELYDELPEQVQKEIFILVSL